MPFVNFRTNFASFPSIFARILMFEHFRGDCSYAELKFFLRVNQKKFFPKIFTLVLLDGFLDSFSKFWFFIGEICILIRDFWVIFENYSMRMLSILSILGTNFRACSASGKMWRLLHVQSMLSIRGMNFIAHWAYGELISSHAEHTRKCLKVEYLGRIEYDLQKSRVTGPWDHKVSVSEKKIKKKIHACVPFIRTAKNFPLEIQVSRKTGEVKYFY